MNQTISPSITYYLDFPFLSFAAINIFVVLIFVVLVNLDTERRVKKLGGIISPFYSLSFNRSYKVTLGFTVLLFISTLMVLYI